MSISTMTGCQSPEQQQENEKKAAAKRIADSLEVIRKQQFIETLVKYVIVDSVGYDPTTFKVDKDNKEMMALYSILAAYSSPAEIDLGHQLPYGGIIEMKEKYLLSIILAKQVYLNKQLLRLVGIDTFPYQTMGSSYLLNIDESKEAETKQARIYDQNFTLEEKAWLYRTGGNTIPVECESECGFYERIAMKVLIKQISLQKILNILERQMQDTTRTR